MKRILIVAITTVAFAFTGATAMADLAILADIPISYDYAEGGSADDVSGIKVGFTFPGGVGIGAETYEFDDVVKFSMIDVYYALPVPVVNVVVGGGGGLGELEIAQDTGAEGMAVTYWVSVGFPIAVLFDVHVGYQVISSTVTYKDDFGNEYDFDIGGTMITLGGKIGF